MQRTLVITAIALGFGWHTGVTVTGFKLAAANVAVQQASPSSRSTPPQSIRIEPIDATHVRLRLEGRENWVVDSMGFTLSPSLDGPPGGVVRVVAKLGANTVTVPGASTAMDRFELSIAPSESLHVEAGSEPR